MQTCMSCCIVIGGCLGIGVGCMYLQLLFDRARLTNVSCTCVCMCVWCMCVYLSSFCTLFSSIPKTRISTDTRVTSAPSVVLAACTGKSPVMPWPLRRAGLSNRYQPPRHRRRIRLSRRAWCAGRRRGRTRFCSAILATHTTTLTASDTPR